MESLIIPTELGDLSIYPARQRYRLGFNLAPCTVNGISYGRTTGDAELRRGDQQIWDVFNLHIRRDDGSYREATHLAYRRIRDVITDAIRCLSAAEHEQLQLIRHDDAAAEIAEAIDKAKAAIDKLRGRAPEDLGYGDDHALFSAARAIEEIVKANRESAARGC